MPARGRPRCISTSAEGPEAQTPAGSADSGPVWRHYLIHGRTLPELSLAGHDADATRAVLAAETEPRFSRFAGADVLLMRGVNFNAGDRLEDMVSLRMLIAGGRLETVARRPVRAVDAVQTYLDAHPQSSAGEIVLQLIENMTGRLNDAVEELSNQLDDLEDLIESPSPNPEPQDLARLRRRSIWLHRFCHPQARALEEAAAARPAWLDGGGRIRLGEQRHAMARIVADLAALRDHSRLLQERTDQELRERMRRTSFALAMIAGVFLPLNLAAAIFGANVGGIPFADHPYGFWFLIAGTAAMMAAGLGLLRWLRWL